MLSKFVHRIIALRFNFRRWQKLVVLLSVCLIMSGCVNYRVGVEFDSPNRGAIVQHIKFNDRISSLGTGTAQAWFSDIEQRARRLSGKVRRLSPKEAIVTIPFVNGKDLEKKFNQFTSFEPDKKSRAKRKVELPAIESHFTVQQGNFLLLERTRLIYDVDLRSLGVTAPDGDVLVDPSSIINLEFGLTAPWGARSINRTKDGVAIPARRDGKQLVWQLQPGQKNHLEAAFWMPSPLGIGTVVVVAIVIGGIYLKEQRSTLANA